MYRAVVGPHIAVVGGGASGCGAARELLLRGYNVTLIEEGDLGCGTSSRFHGMLQSGARYAVSDTAYAAECMRDRRRVAALVPEAVEETGGLFVSLSDDPPEYADQFLRGCRKAGIPVEELEPERVMAEEPNISRRVKRAFSVPDATVQPWILLNRLAEDVRARGGRLWTRHRVCAVRASGHRVASLEIDGPNGREELGVDAVVNAAGPWAGRFAAMFGGKVELELGKGSILVFARRMVSRIVNRCRPPTSHDIMVPTGTVCLFGTTSKVVDDPDTTTVLPEEIQALLDGAEPLVPGIRDYRALRAWAGVRPLVKPANWPQGVPVPRRHRIIDHADDGMTGAFTVCGGSFTSHRSMAEDLANHVARLFGANDPQPPPEIPLVHSGEAVAWRPTDNYERIEEKRAHTELLCECEGVSISAVQAMIRDTGARSLHDLRRRLRVGFGPCQGTFCGNRLACCLAAAGGEGIRELEAFWAERLKGAAPMGYGQNARQLMLSDLVHREILGVQLREAGSPRV